MLIGSVRRDGHHAAAPWHFLYFLPLPHGHGSLRPTFGPSCRTVLIAASSPPTRGGCCWVAVARGGAAVAVADRGAPNTDEAAASAPGSLRISGARRCGARRTGAAAASSLSTGRSHHR